MISITFNSKETFVHCNRKFNEHRLWTTSFTLLEHQRNLNLYQAVGIRVLGRSLVHCFAMQSQFGNFGKILVQSRLDVPNSSKLAKLGNKPADLTLKQTKKATQWKSGALFKII